MPIGPFPPITIEPLQSAYSVQFNSHTNTFDIKSGKNVLALDKEIVISPEPDLEVGSKILALGIGPNPLLGALTYVGAVEVGSSYVGFLVEQNQQYYLISQSNLTLSPGEPITINPAVDWNLRTNEPLCFVAGTMIMTPHGEVPVETLQPGSMVTLADGGAAPITWMGRQTISTRYADPLLVQPIRVLAGALDDGVPARDLLLSCDHALLVDGFLVQAGALVNGLSILRETDMPEMFTYYHVELENHALILAEGAPAETFIDNASRMAFDNWDEHPNNMALVEMDLPRAKSSRQLPSHSRDRLTQRAEALFGNQTRAVA